MQKSGTFSPSHLHQPPGSPATPCQSPVPFSSPGIRFLSTTAATSLVHIVTISHLNVCNQWPHLSLCLQTSFPAAPTNLFSSLQLKEPSKMRAFIQNPSRPVALRTKPKHTHTEILPSSPLCLCTWSSLHWEWVGVGGSGFPPWQAHSHYPSGLSRSTRKPS